MPARPVRLPDEAEIARYEADGACVLRGVYGREWVALLRDGVAQAMASCGRYSRRIQDKGDPVFFTDYLASDRVAALKRFALEGPAGELAAALMRSRRANFLFDGVFVKESGASKPSLYHQDQPYYCVEGRQIVVLWAPLDRVPAEVSLRCVKGSHRWPLPLAPLRFRDGGGFGRGSEGHAAPGDIEARHGGDLLSWELEPGDVVAFHGMTVHGAPGNPQTDRRRRATNTTWVGDDAVYVERPGIMEPDFPDCGLRPGEPLDCPRFPRVFEAPPQADEGLR